MKADTKAQVLAADLLAEDLDTIRGSDSAPEIVACARRHLANEEVQRAAFQALKSFWPGFLSCPDTLPRMLRRIEAQRRLAASPLGLVPIEPEEMEDGRTYLAATFGTTGMVADVIQGNRPELATDFAALFRIDVLSNDTSAPQTARQRLPLSNPPARHEHTAGNSRKHPDQPAGHQMALHWPGFPV